MICLSAETGIIDNFNRHCWGLTVLTACIAIAIVMHKHRNADDALYS